MYSRSGLKKLETCSFHQNIEKGIIVSVDEDAGFNDQQKDEMWVNDSTTSDGIEISVVS